MTTTGIIIFVALLLIFYTVLVYTAGSKKGANSVLWNWWHRLVSTVASILLGVVVAVQMFNYQRSQQREAEKGRFISILAAELSDMQRVLVQGESMNISFGNFQYNTLVTYLQPLAIEQAAQSGLFNLVDTENLYHVARKVRLLNTETEFFLSLVASSAFDEQRLHFATRNVDKTRLAILENISELNRQLDLKISFTANVTTNASAL